MMELMNMKKTLMAFFVLLMMAFANGYGQEPSRVEKVVGEIVKKYDDTNGVECVTVVKGGGMEMVKLLFNKQFGKDFMKGVTSITIINYSDAPEEVCLALRKELDAFITLLEEFNVGEEEQFADNDYVRSFASASSDTGTLSDFVIAIERKDSKMIMYMAGDIKVE